MRLEELLVKLEQIERQAALTVEEHPRGLAVERQRLIMAIARQLQSHLRDQVEAGPREPVTEPLSQLNLVSGGDAPAS